MDATTDVLSKAFTAFEAGDLLFPPLEEDFEVDDLFSADFVSLLQGEAGSVGAPAPEGLQQLFPGASQLPLVAPCPPVQPAPACASSPSVETAPASPSLPCEAAPAPAVLPHAPVLPSSPKARTDSNSLPLSACAPALRLVTTSLFGNGAHSAELAAFSAAAAAAAASCPTLLALQQAGKVPSEQRPSCSTGSQDSDDTMDGEDEVGTSNKDGAPSKPNKRKAPEVDWRKIEDPAERRRQRRLAKNRVTAARSRERKKLQWADMEAKIQSIESENAQLRSVLEQFARENTALKEQLMSLTRPGGAKRMNLSLGRKSTTTEPAALVLIATLLVLCCFLPADKAMMLGSALPLLVLVQLLKQQGKDGADMFEALFKVLAALHTLFAKSSRGLKRYMHTVLYKRHHHCGRKVLQNIANTSQHYDVKALLEPSKNEPLDELMPDQDLAVLPTAPGLQPHQLDDTTQVTGFVSDTGFCAPFADIVIKPEMLLC